MSVSFFEICPMLLTHGNEFAMAGVSGENAWFEDR